MKDDVYVNGRRAAKVGDRSLCPKHGWAGIFNGSSTVSINGRLAARQGDHLLCALNDVEAKAMIDAAWKRLSQHPEEAGLGDWIEQTGVPVVPPSDGNKGHNNPYAGLNKTAMLAAYKAGVATGTPPQDVLALATKEGGGVMAESLRDGWTSKSGEASSAGEARSLGRAHFLYSSLGADEFTRYEYVNAVVNGVKIQENLLVYDARVQDSTFQTALRERYGSHGETIGTRIDASLDVASTDSGRYRVKPGMDFYSQAMAISIDEFNRLGRIEYTELGREIPTKELNYLRWNNGPSKFKEFLKNHGGASAAEVDQWAVHTSPKEHEWPQARRNAIRFGYFRKAFELIYADVMAATMRGADIISTGSSDVEIGG